MRIGLYNPYYDGFGGGERYTLTLASKWSRSHQVELFWDDAKIVEQSEKRFHLDLSHVRVVPNIFGGSNFFRKMFVSRMYDLIFFLTDGSVPTSLARHNILHFQVPFAHISASAFKLHRFDNVICNSKYTQSYIDPKVARLAQVIYPPVIPIHVPKNNHKKKIILSVGRFTSVHEAKKQSVMIEAFIRLEDRLPDWKLVLAGGLLPTDREYFASLQKKIAGHRIRLAPNSTHDNLNRLYADAMFYWHAAGIGENDPRFMEHFGISTIEAMSAGAVPVVYNGGGQAEIVTHRKNGLLWSTVDELVTGTLRLEADAKAYAHMQQLGLTHWEKFSQDSFMDQFNALLAAF